MRRLSAGVAAALGVFLAIPRGGLNAPKGSHVDDTIAAVAIVVGIVVTILAGKATTVAAGRGVAGRFLVCLVAGSVLVPLCVLVLAGLIYFSLGGLWQFSVIILGTWLYGLRAWVIGGVLGMTVAVFWPGRKHEAPGTAQ